MKHLFILSLFCISGQCYGSAFDADTIDNWQIYNGTELVLAGNEVGEHFEGVIKMADLKDLTIIFNHCAPVAEDLEISIEIEDKDGNKILTSNFKKDPQTRITISKKELKRIAPRIITIRYHEKKKNGTNKVLGQIKFV